MLLIPFDSMLVKLQPVQKREAGVTANVLISLIDRMKGLHRCQFDTPKLKQTHTISIVVLLSMRERKIVQEGRWFTLRIN